MKQVDKEHYDFSKYCYPERWASYYRQIKLITDLRIGSVLEIGAGDEVVKSYITHNTGIAYTNLDVAEDLKPMVVGSIEAMPFADSSFDAVCAFEVLEHLPFEKFENCLLEMKRVARQYVLISVPHFGPPLKLAFKIPFLPEVKIVFKIPLPFKHVFNGQHYWELGKKGYPVRRVRKILAKHFTIQDEFIPFESQYHHFFVMKK